MSTGALTMNNLPHRPAKLRTKTGCLTCRNRRKKCDEKSPICGRCSQSNRACLWPTSADLVDRRYANHERSRYATSPKSGDQESSPEDTAVESSLVFRLSESVAHGAMSHDLEGVVTRHFVNHYYDSLILPNSHPAFSNGWMSEIQRLMGEWKSVRYSVLCNAASNLHFIESNSKMQELALTYYSKALRGLSDVLARAELTASCNTLLTSMMLLYLHGCIGRGTYFDIPRHLNAAMRVLALRLFRQTPTISTPFDRLAVESVFYQIFLASTGLWSDEETNHRLDYNFDLDFWLRAERLLDQSRVFPGQSNAMNSPVLGVPVSLFRLALTLKQMYQGVVSYDQRTLAELKNEIEVWEALVLCDQETDELGPTEERNRKHDFYKSASYLFILFLSLLLEQIITPSVPPVVQEQNAHGLHSSVEATHSRPPLPAHPESWQILKATQIIQSYAHDDAWASCFIGNWPLYSIGFFMATPEHVQLTRNELRRRWDLMRWNQVARFRNDLEKTWTQRGVGDPGAEFPVKMEL
ncbi:hypothetical protein BU23DRAFT_255576 [Bimuria novae-zelandiae CBS 107.79]|uniref:Zn(2)-C6 fungal-type domain-containing protein n=1 Tax=Bimuria novae-zelandiae CBS 107.79 TaxID=1447943 RepID=A0A6A5V6G4_9PLEO|nr:hypothetical protein BU23DRAFT_255576 [Bimuria novae-zelandiae CBS 107.79]